MPSGRRSTRREAERIKDELIALLADYAARGTPCVLATVVRCDPPTSARPGDKAVITADGRLRGWIGGSCSEPVVRREALRALSEGTPRLVRIVPADETRQTRTSDELTLATTCPSGGSLEIFIEPELPRPQLIVFGNSPAARTLVQLGGLTGFRTCSVHPGARAEDYPTADQVLTSLDLSALAPGADSWAIVVTMGHYDEDALEAALAHPDLHVALVASQRRALAVLEALRARGLDEATLARVRSPAGGARSARQEEIALLALAEVVTERRACGFPSSAPELPRFATDPVCGMTVDVESARQAPDGESKFYFCCDACRDRFVAEPERYRSDRHALAAEQPDEQ
jgi:xanthine dehydrogenase accessory factor